VPDFGPRPEPLHLIPPSVPHRPVASRPDPWAADLKPFRPYRYRGLGFDIFNPDEEDDDDC
jgi:hypothetical protein